MPFDYAEYRAECKGFSNERLQQEYQRYVRIMGSSSASTGISTGLAIFTFGLSLIGTAAGVAAARNAFKKAEIIEEECRRRGISPTFRKRDFFAGYGVGCTVGVVTHGAGGHVIDSAVHHAVNHTVQHTAQHAASVAHTSHTLPQDKLLKAVEHGADKLTAKGGEELEKKAYGVKALSRELTHAEKYGDGKFPPPCCQLGHASLLTWSVKEHFWTTI